MSYINGVDLNGLISDNECHETAIVTPGTIDDASSTEIHDRLASIGIPQTTTPFSPPVMMRLLSGLQAAEQPWSVL